MSNDKNKDKNLDAKQAEDNALKETSDEDIRKEVIEKYDLDEEEQEGLVNKLTEQEKEHKKTLSTAIRQKRDYRKEVKELKEKSSSSEDKKNSKNTSDDIDSVVEKKLRKKELDSIEGPEGFVDEVKKYAKLHPEKPVNEILNEPYIKYVKEEKEKEKRTEKAGASNKHKSKTGRDFGDLSKRENLQEALRNVDLSTEEGMKDYEKIKKQIKNL